MKLLIVGNKAKWALEKYYSVNLNYLGLKTSIFNVLDYYSDSIIFKVLYKLKFYFIFKKLNSDLINFTKKNKPNFIWIFKGVEIFPSTLKILKELNIILLNFNPDHPFIRYSPSHGGKNIEKSLQFYDIIFSYRKDLVKLFNKKYNVKSYLLPFGYFEKNIKYNKLKSVYEINKVCFVGTPDKLRSEIILKLAKNNIEIDIFSGTYPNKNILKHKNIKLNDVVLDEEFWITIRKYRIQLNFLRLHNQGSHNQRTFEVPAVGGILLSEFSIDQCKYFAQEKEMFFFKNFDELVYKVKYLQSLKESDIYILRDNARNRCLSDKYSYLNRSKFIFKILKEY